MKKNIGSIYGPNICGDTIDTYENGTIVTGAWRGNSQIEMWSCKTRKRKSIHMWNGDTQCMTAYIYGLRLGQKGDFCIAGTSKANEVKIFDNADGW